MLFGNALMLLDGWFKLTLIELGMSFRLLQGWYFLVPRLNETSKKLTVFKVVVIVIFKSEFSRRTTF